MPIIEQMFDHHDAGIGLLPGRGTEYLSALTEEELAVEDQIAYEATCRELADGWEEPDRHLLPSDLESIPPGLFLAAIVASVDRTRLNGHDAVRLMQAEARLSSHHEAGKLASMTEVAFSPPGDADSPVEREICEIDFVAAEVAAALTLTRRASEAEVNRAVSLTGRLHRVWEAFSEGLLDARKVKVLDSQLSHLPAETIDRVLDEVLEEASGWTTGQLQARVAKQVMASDPDGAASSFEEGLGDRKVTTHANPDFTASFHVHSVRPEAAAAARAHIERLARQFKIGGDKRTLDQIRADVAVDLLRGKHTGSGDTGGGKANITISAETLVKLSDEPGELDGFGPVIAEIARKTVRENVDGEWVFTVSDNGKPVATGTLARRPTAGQQRHVEAAYQLCVWPGCRMPATESDLDHHYPWGKGGPTTLDKLAPLSRHHHVIRHNTPWQYQRLPNGDHQWTSPLGHTYIRKRDPPD